MTVGEALRRFAEFPVRNVVDWLGDASPMVLAPHADDESLGCGGLLALSVAAGLRPAVVIVTDGTGSHPHSKRYPAERLRGLREDEARAAVAELGVAPERLAFMRVRDTAAPQSGPDFERAVGGILEFVRTFRSGALLAPWRHDPHGDHLAVQLMAREAADRASIPVYEYPVWGLTLPEQSALADVAPKGIRLDVGAVLDRKRRAIAAHRTQYDGIVDDDPDGFQLDPSFVNRFLTNYETFLTHG